MDRPAFSPGGFGAPPPPLQQQRQQYQPADSAVHCPDNLHTAMHTALGPFVQQNKGISAIDIGALMDHLEMLMKDCSQANIQAGKNWVVHFCQNPQQYDVLMRALVNIAISRSTFDDKLHIVYLTNDVLSHCERKQQQWIKEAVHPHLVPMLRAAYFFPGIDDSQRQRVIKVLDIWRTREFFPPSMIDSIELHVKRPPVLPNNGQGPTSPQEQWQAQGQQPPFHPPAHPHSQPPPPPQQFQFQHQQQQYFPQHPQFQQHYPHQQQQQQFPGFAHHPQQQIQNQHLLSHHPHSQQFPHADPWTPPAPGAHPGYPSFQSNAPNPQHPPPGVPPPLLHHQPNPFPQASPAFQNHQQQPPFQQPPPLQQPSPQLPFPHVQRFVPAPAPVSAPAPPPPEPTHRNVLTRNLHAGQMVSKIDDDADYYEPLPAYVSVPVKKKAHQDKDLLDSVAQFIQETNALKAEDLIKGDEGWHEGRLDGVYRKHGDKRKDAFSDFPRQRRRRSCQRSDPSDRKGELRGRERSFSRTPSRSRSRSASRTRRRSLRSRSRSFSRSRDRSGSPQYRRRDRRRSRDRSGSRERDRSMSRSRSRSRNRSMSRGGKSRSKSRDAGPRQRSIDEAFPTRKFGLGSNSQQQQQSSPSRPSFQPARFSQ